MEFYEFESDSDILEESILKPIMKNNNFNKIKEKINIISDKEFQIIYDYNEDIYNSSII